MTNTTQYKTVKGSYKLAATYCEPDNGPGDAVQVLTHGVGFDRSYWDYPYANFNYSYVDEAVKHGYSTLSWDRLGIGASSHGDPVNEIQINLEIAALVELTKRLHDGNICGVKHKFKKHYHAGHSFGSAMTYGFASEHPDQTDGIILTGFSQAPGFIGLFALGGNFVPVSRIDALKDKYTTGYIGPASTIGVHIQFYGPGDFSQDILEYSTKNGQPAAIGELLTTGGPIALPNKYTGDVLIITGDRDVPFCGGDCHATGAINGTAPDLLEFSKPMFKQAKSFKTSIVPEAGHGLNFGYSHVETYKRINDWLKSVA